MAPLLQELSSLKVEPLEIIVDTPESEQSKSLYTHSHTLNEIVTLLADTPSPVGETDCCCCCPVCFFACC